MAEPSLSLNDRVVLALVCESPRHGFAIARELTPDAPLGSIWRVRRPQVYRSIDRLVSHGLAVPAQTEPGAGGPERQVVRATPAGRASAARWAVAPVDRLRDARTELLVKLAVCRRLGLDGAALLRAQTQVVDRIVARLAARSASTDEALLPLLWRRQSAAAARRFVDDAAAWWESRSPG
ncbi:MAG TPA: PadR family transcriptional regulator [Acidimicrobiales bacterium]